MTSVFHYRPWDCRGQTYCPPSLSDCFQWKSKLNTCVLGYVKWQYCKTRVVFPRLSATDDNSCAFSANADIIANELCEKTKNVELSQLNGGCFSLAPSVYWYGTCYFRYSGILKWARFYCLFDFVTCLDLIVTVCVCLGLTGPWSTCFFINRRPVNLYVPKWNANGMEWNATYACVCDDLTYIFVVALKCQQLSRLQYQ